jgi:hypothetical protein
MPEITFWHTDFTEEDVHDGDIHAESYREVVPVEDVEGAAAALLDAGLTESSSTRPSPGDWFCDPDGSRWVDQHTGIRRATTGRVHGLSDADFGRIANIVARARRS